MSLLVLHTAQTEPVQGPTVQAALHEARRQGFDEPHTLQFGNRTAWWFATPDNPGGSGGFIQEGESFAVYVGTAHWRGLTGGALLRALLAQSRDPRSLPLDEIGGSFVMLLGDATQAWIFHDALGIHKLYRNENATLMSTSFMVCRATLERPAIDRLRAQEYVLLGANHGLPTPLQGISLVDPTMALELRGGATVPLLKSSRWRGPCPFSDEREAARALAEHIGRDFADIGRALGPNIGMALSGGLDSRVLLAALDSNGLQPHLYVYGRPQDDDVRVAAAVAAALGMRIEPIDKSAMDQAAPPLTRSQLTARLAFFDGLPPDGALDTGSDHDTRLKQVAGGRVNLNGGGGEILRNFFYLRDRQLTPEQVAAAFYSNWRPEVFARPGEADAFRGATAQGIAQVLGAASTRTLLSRSDVELVYPLFRLRWWMGRNNALAGRYGRFLTPLVTPQLVRLAAALPLAWKNHGRLEAAILRALSPRVAQGPSAYGYSFAGEPSLKHRLKVAATLYRPTWLRSQSARLRRSLGTARPPTPAARWQEVAQALPPQDWVNPQALTDDGQLNRLLTLQAVADDDWALGAQPG